MDEILEEEEKSAVAIRRPFQPKFMKQLNVMQTQKVKKSKRKLKSQHQISAIKLEKLEKIGLSHHNRSLKKLPQTNRNGNRILAIWKNNQIHGEAQIYYSNGVVFKGTYQNGIKVKGHFKFLHGYEYIGNCIGNKFDGEGSLVFPSGKIITGEWKDYNLVDKGKIQYPDGEVYYGDIKNLKKHGKGYLFFKDGSKYVGQFDSGLISGYGTYFVNDQAVASGNWVNGQLVSEVNFDQILSEQTGGQNVKEILGMMSAKQIPDNSQNGRSNLKKTSKGFKSFGSSKSVDENKGKVQKKLRFAENCAENVPFSSIELPEL